MAMRPLASLMALMLELLLGSGVGSGLLQVSPQSKDSLRVDAVGFPVPHKGGQMARLQLHYVGVDMAVAFRHHHLAPGFSLIVGDPESGGIAGEAVRGISADPVGEDPAAVGKYLDRLAAEGSSSGKTVS